MANDTAVLPQRLKKPDWLRVKLPVGKKYTELRGLVDKYKLNTICTSGSCPNMGECLVIRILESPIACVFI